jgi:short-subunit dehydrogenase
MSAAVAPVPSSASPLKWVLVTGCSSGIGKALVGALRRQGWGVVASARRLETLADLPTGTDLRILALDVTDAKSLEDARQACEDLRLVALINNAGYGQMGPLEVMRSEDLRAQFETNVIGLQAVTNSFLPLIRAHAKRGEGRIIYVASALGRLSIPLMGAYNASKHAVVALAETLRLEIGMEIPVMLVEPGVIGTAFRSTLVSAWGNVPERVQGTRYQPAIASYQANGEAFPDQKTTSAEVCAERIAKAMSRTHPPRRLLIGADSFWSQVAHRWLPTWMYEKAVRKAYGLA